MDADEAVQTVQAFEDLFRIVEDTAEIGRKLLELVGRFHVKGRVVHDANIVATMSVHGVRRLLTANPADFQRFAEIIDIEPL
jgi:predicted nucleic acid-binding protein